MKRFRGIIYLRAVAWWVVNDVSRHHSTKPISAQDVTEGTKDDDYQCDTDDHEAKALNDKDRHSGRIRNFMTHDIVPGFLQMTVFTHESGHACPITVVLFRIVVWNEYKICDDRNFCESQGGSGYHENSSEFIVHKDTTDREKERSDVLSYILRTFLRESILFRRARAH